MNVTKRQIFLDSNSVWLIAYSWCKLC